VTSENILGLQPNPHKTRVYDALTVESKLPQLIVDERIKLVADLLDSMAAHQGALPMNADREIRCQL
jgi:hypothetical protein